MVGRAICCGFILLALGSSAALARERRERASVALPIFVDAPTDSSARIHSFRQREMFGRQPARYLSAMSVESAIPLPEISAGAGIAAGEALVELRASSRDFSGPVYCTLQTLNPTRSAMLCLADRDRDGAFDQLWVGAAASRLPLIPFPDIRSLRTIAPVRARPVESRAIPTFQIGFYVSGTNPLLGQHHFYPVLGADMPGYPVFAHHRAVAMRGLPKAVPIWDAELTIRSFSDRTYEAAVTRPFPAGERLVVSPYPTRTIYISSPG